jgi:hypothetical protein
VPCRRLSTDFNCTVTDPAYVTDLLDRLRDEAPRLYGMILYVEQPFPYDLEAHLICRASRGPASATAWRRFAGSSRPPPSNAGRKPG